MVWCCLLCAVSVHAEPPDLAWVPATELRRIELEHATPVATLAPVDDREGEIALGPRQSLLIPAAGGAVVRLEGQALEVGFGTGFGPVPDAILWRPTAGDAGAQVIRVPTWGVNQLLVVRGQRGRAAGVKVRVAARRNDPMRWFHADREIAAWLRRAAAPAPILGNPLEDAQPIVGLLAAVREAFGADAAEPAVTALLLARWLGDSVVHRPMDGPFFASVDVRLEGGALPPPDPERAGRRRLARRIVDRGGSLLVEGTQLDAVTLLLSTRADWPSVVRVRAGDTLVQEVRTEVPLHARDVLRWTSPRQVRAVPAQGRLTVEIVAGTVQVTVLGYEQRNAAGTPLARERERLLRRAAAADDEPSATLPRRVVAALARAEAARSRAAAADLLVLAAEPGVSPALRAVLRHDAIRNGLDFATVEARLGELGVATAELSPSVSLPLRRSALGHVVAATSTAPEGFASEVLAEFGRGGGSGEDAERIALYRELLVPPRDRARSVTAASAEASAARSALNPDSLFLAGQAWRRIAPWANVPAGDGSPTVQRFAPAAPEPDSDGLCPLVDANGVRWLRLGADTRLAVGDRGGTHTTVLFRGDPAEPLGDSEVQIDDVPAAVHGGAGLRSAVAVAPGPRAFRRLSGAPVLAKIPADDRLDCARLRDEVSWVVVRDRALFPIAAGAALTVASVVIAAESVTHPAEVRIEVGATSYHGRVVPPATGSFEVPVPAGATALSLRVSRPLLARVLVRRHRGPAAEPRPPPRERAAELDEAAALQQIRAATQALRRASDDAGRIAAWRARARGLEALGFRRLAAADWRRLAVAGGVPDAPEAADPLAPLTQDLPPGSPPVVPLGSLPLIPPLPQPANERVLRQVLAAQELAADPTLLLAQLAPSAARSSAVDALLLAVLAEGEGQAALAAGAYARIGRVHRSPRALALAGSLSADEALATNDLDAVLGAYLLAREAGEADTRAAGVLARLQDALDWEQLGADEAAGSVMVEAYRYTDFTAAPLGVRVRRALLDAPPFAVLSHGDPVVTPLRGGGNYRVDAACHAFDGPQEGCATRIELDGKPVTCRPLTDEAPLGASGPPPVAAAADPSPVAPGTVGADERVAQEHGCWLEAPEGAARLAIAPPKGRETLAWVAVRRYTESGLDPVRLVARWTEATPEAPFRLVVRGPVVLRVTARGEGGVIQHLERRVGGGAASATTTAPLDAGTDDYAWRRPDRDPIGPPSTSYLAIPEPGPHPITLAPDRGRAFLRVEVARARALPRPSPPAAAAPLEPVPQARAALPPEIVPQVGWDRPTGPLTVSAGATYVIADLTEADRDPRTDYGELTLSVRRKLDGPPVWVRATLLTRVRSGPETMGAETRLSLGRTAWHPAGFVLGRVLVQQLPPANALGWLGVVSTYHTIRLSRDADLVPLGTLSTRITDPRARGEASVDPGIYSTYSAAHPASLDLVLRVDERPFVDLRGRVGSLVRLLPEGEVVDRVDGFVEATLLGGTWDAPELGVELRVSERPPNDIREAAFTRLQALGSMGLCVWAGNTGRWTVDSGLGWVLDLPATNGPPSAVTGTIGVGYDFVAGRGVRDLDPGARAFSQRLEEGHAPATRIPPRGHAAWEPPP